MRIFRISHNHRGLSHIHTHISFFRMCTHVSFQDAIYLALLIFIDPKSKLLQKIKGTFIENKKLLFLYFTFSVLTRKITATFKINSLKTLIQKLCCLTASQVALVVKNPPANAGNRRNAGLIPGSGTSPGGGHGNPLQDSCLESPMDRGAWWATVHRVTKNRTQRKQLRYYLILKVGNWIFHWYFR